jgi:Uma2 family endonuclease
MIVRAIDEDLLISVPPDAHNLEGFRTWLASPSFPENISVSLIQGDVWIDMSPEEFQSHTKVKTKIASVLDQIVGDQRSGDLYGDGGYITNDAAGLSTVPDALYVRYETLKAGLAEYVSRGEGRRGIELRGRPDWVLEVVSPSSIRKDSELLPEAYYKAGIPEFWLVDARGDHLEFTIYRHGKQAYEAIEPQEGWSTSHVFRRQFRLERELDEVGGWIYKLHVREIPKS